MRLLEPLAPPLCVACRAPAGRQRLCAACRRALQWLPRAPVALGGLRVWAPLRYEGPARAVVARLKFHGAAGLADHMAAAIAAGAPAGMLSAPLVPVPGRPHAEWLADALARRGNLRVVRLLSRSGGPRQVGRSRAERLRSPPSFAALAQGAGPLVLVDDVVTTGATLGACAAVLSRAGWTCDSAVAYARTGVR